MHNTHPDTEQKTVAVLSSSDQTPPRRTTRQKAVRPTKNVEAPPNAPYRGKPEYKPFVEKLRAAMEAAGMTASELAARIWGRTTDSRGYNVARGRDRIGHYLSGVSYPEPANLELLAQTLGIPVAELAIERPVGAPAPRSRPATANLQVSSVPEQPDKMRVQLDEILDWKLAMYIGQLIKLYEAREEIVVPGIAPGTVINGDKDDDAGASPLMTNNIGG